MILDKNANKHKGQFDKMTKSELRKVIDGYHLSKDYGPEFRSACEVFNNKFRINSCVFINGEPVL